MRTTLAIFGLALFQCSAAFTPGFGTARARQIASPVVSASTAGTRPAAFALTNQKPTKPLILKSASHSLFAASTSSKTALRMSDSAGGGGTARQKTKKRKRTVITKDRTDVKAEEDKKPEEQWRVVLHNDEVHTFHYVIRSLCKVIGTVDRKRAFDICVVTHGTGKATITKTWKKQAEQYCLGLQRQGLTASIAPDENFDGGHAGGGL